MDILEMLKLEWFLRARKAIKWTTRDSKQIPIAELDNKHLVNIINMLERQGEEEFLWDEMLENSDIIYKDYINND